MNALRTKDLNRVKKIQAVAVKSSWTQEQWTECTLAFAEATEDFDEAEFSKKKNKVDEEIY